MSPAAIAVVALLLTSIITPAFGLLIWAGIKDGQTVEIDTD